MSAPLRLPPELQSVPTRPLEVLSAHSNLRRLPFASADPPEVAAGAENLLERISALLFSRLAFEQPLILPSLKSISRSWLATEARVLLSLSDMTQPSGRLGSSLSAHAYL